MWQDAARMDILVKVFKWIASILVAILAPLLLIVIGALMVGYGGYKDLQWVMNGGMFLAALGIIWIVKGWWD